MEERPSRLEISVSSIKEFDITEAEIKTGKRQSDLKRKSTTTNPVKAASRDDVPGREPSDTAPDQGVKRTASLSAAKQHSQSAVPAVYKSASSESADKKKSLSTVAAAKKRSSSVEQQAKTQSQVTLKDGKSGSAVKISATQSVVNKKSSAEKAKTQSSVKVKESKSKQGVDAQISEIVSQYQKHSAPKITARESSSSALRKRSSSSEQYKQSTSNTALKGQDSNQNVKSQSKTKSKSADAENKRENAHDANRQGVSSSAPTGRRQSKDSIGFTGLLLPGMALAAFSKSSQAVKPSKSSRQTGDQSHSHAPARTGSGGPHHAASKDSEHADRSRLSSGTHHSSSAGRQRRDTVLFTDCATPFSETPFPFHDVRHRTDSAGDVDNSWVQQALETPTPWGGLGSETAAALLATSSGATVRTKRSSTGASVPKLKTSKKEHRTSKLHGKHSQDHRHSSSDEEQQQQQQQCLSLSMAGAVIDEKKRSFFTVLDEETLEKLRERAEELRQAAEAQALEAQELTPSRALLQEANGSTTNTKRTASGRRVSSGTSIAAGGKGPKTGGEEGAKGSVSGESVLKPGESELQSRLITLENPFKKNKKHKEDENEMKNIYATALLDKWMQQGANENTNASASKNSKHQDAKSKKIGFLKQLLGAKKQTTTKEKVLHTLTEKKINLLIPQSLPNPRVVDPADQIPTVDVAPPTDALADAEAGHSQGPDARRIQEEFFASTDLYRSSIAHARQRLVHRHGPGVPGAATKRPAPTVRHAAGTSTDPIEAPAAEGAQKPAAEEGDGEADEAEMTLADAAEQEQALRAQLAATSSSEVTLVDEDGKVSRRRKSSLRRKRASSAEKYHQWKRKTSTKAYIEYQRRTDPRFHTDDDATSQSTSLSLYPVSSSETVPAGGRASWSDISSVQTVPEPTATADGSPPKSFSRATSTDERGRTEGTQTSSTEYLLLDRRSCLVKVLAALQRLNTDEALQVARILRRSLDENRVYEDVSVKQIMEPRDGAGAKKPLTRVESEKVVARGSPSRSGVIPEMISDQDYDELTRVVSQIDLMVRSKLRITAAPYSLIYETLINYHLEITQDYSPSVAVFNYYLTEQGHPLFDDTSGFFRPTILQVPRESLYPRLYAHKPYEEPRELPAGGRLLDLQLLLDELLICPFCGQDVIWGQTAMCVEFCCDSFAEVISREYEDDLGRIRRQAALWQRRAAIGELEEDADLLAAALSAASSDQQAPAKVQCLIERRTRLRALRRYGQDGGGKAPHLLPFDMDMVKKASGVKAPDDGKERKHKSHHKSRRKSSGQDDVTDKKSASRRRSQRHASEGGRKRSRTKRSSGGVAAGDDSPGGGKRGSRGGRKSRRTTKRDMLQEVEKIEERMGRRLTQDELEAILDGEGVMQSDARGLSITAGGIEEKLDVTSLENIPDRGPSSRRKSPKASRDFLLDDAIGIRLSSYMRDNTDTETADTESTAPPPRKKGKDKSGGAGKKSRKKARARERDRETTEGSTIALDGHEGSKTKRAEKAERDSVSPDDQLHPCHAGAEKAERDSVSPDDQLHYRLSESTFLEEGVTQLPWEDEEDGNGDASQPLQQLITQPAEIGTRQFLQEYYPDGSLFVTWFDDGSGHVMYPSGEPAILITVEPAGRRFVVLPDQPCADLISSNCVLAMFDPRGVGFVYSPKGEPRLLLDQREGWYHRDDGNIRRWHWSDLDDHIHHSPTLQPVIFAISRHVAIRVIRQDYIVLSFWAHQRSARFNVGVTAEPAPESPSPGLGPPPPPDQFRLVCQTSDRLELAELRDRVRRILADMARITDEPVKYLIHQQRIGRSGLSAALRRPAPRWLTAEPRRPRLPDGVSAALGRRSAAATAVGTSARRAFLLQQMALLGAEPERRAGSAAGAPQPQPRSPSQQTLQGLPAAPPPPALVTTLVSPPTEVA